MSPHTLPARLRCSCGRARWTFRTLPWRSVPSSATMAFSALASVFISMNPNPLDRPVHRSVIILNRRTMPCFSKSGRISCSVTFGWRFPTRMLFTMGPFIYVEVQSRGSKLFSSAQTHSCCRRRRDMRTCTLRTGAVRSRHSQIRSFLRFVRSYRLPRLRGAQFTFGLREDVRAILPGVSESLSSAQKHPPISGHRL